MKKLNLVGKKFGNLTVLKKLPNKGKSKWLCKCDCGETTRTLGSNLTTGKSKSCGCSRGKSRKTHGLSNHRLYHCWYDMNKRCHDLEHPWFHAYGARGVGVDPRWHYDNPEGMKNFVEDMETTYFEGASLDKDLSGGKFYSKDTCTWITPSANSKHTSQSKLPQHHQEVVDLKSRGFTNKFIASKFKVSPSTVSHYLKRNT